MIEKLMTFRGQILSVCSTEISEFNVMTARAQRYGA